MIANESTTGDPHREQHVDYHHQRNDGVRDIKTATSDDFLNWTDPDWLVYPPGTPTKHLYTNAVLPYKRAPHLLLGFPTRYNPDTSQVEPILMSSRNGVTFERWQEALIPITAPEDRDRNRVRSASCYSLARRVSSCGGIKFSILIEYGITFIDLNPTSRPVDESLAVDMTGMARLRPRLTLGNSPGPDSPMGRAVRFSKTSTIVLTAQETPKSTVETLFDSARVGLPTTATFSNASRAMKLTSIPKVGGDESTTRWLYGATRQCGRLFESLVVSLIPQRICMRAGIMRSRTRCT